MMKQYRGKLFVLITISIVSITFCGNKESNPAQTLTGSQYSKCIDWDKFYENRQLFKSKSLSHYSYTLTRSGGRFYAIKKRIEVKDGVFSSPDNKKTKSESLEERYSIEKLFNMVENLCKIAEENKIKEGTCYVERIIITYSKEFGYPESIHLEYHVPQGVDNDSLTDYTITDFKVIKE